MSVAFHFVIPRENNIYSITDLSRRIISIMDKSKARLPLNPVCVTIDKAKLLVSERWLDFSIGAKESVREEALPTFSRAQMYLDQLATHTDTVLLPSWNDVERSFSEKYQRTARFVNVIVTNPSPLQVYFDPGRQSLESDRIEGSSTLVNSDGLEIWFDLVPLSKDEDVKIGPVKRFVARNHIAASLSQIASGTDTQLYACIRDEQIESFQVRENKKMITLEDLIEDVYLSSKGRKSDLGEHLLLAKMKSLERVRNSVVKCPMDFYSPTPRMTDGEFANAIQAIDRSIRETPYPYQILDLIDNLANANLQMESLKTKIVSQIKMPGILSLRNDKHEIDMIPSGLLDELEKNKKIEERLRILFRSGVKELFTSEAGLENAVILATCRAEFKHRSMLKLIGETPANSQESSKKEPDVQPGSVVFSKEQIALLYQMVDFSSSNTRLFQRLYPKIKQEMPSPLRNAMSEISSKLLNAYPEIEKELKSKLKDSQDLGL